MNLFAYYVLQLTLILSFNIGLLATLSIAEPITRLIIDILIIILFVISLITTVQKKLAIFPFFKLVLLIFLITFISYLFTDVTLVDYLMFHRKVLLYFFFFYALFNINFSKVQIEKVFKVIIILFLTQIFATFIKLLTVGVMEPYIGTIGILGGSIATIMPLIALSYIFSTYLVEKKTTILLLVPLFIMIGIASSKIAIIVYLFALFSFLLLIYTFKNNGMFINLKLFFKYTLMALLLLGSVSSAYISLNPRLNPEGKVGGSINFKHIENYFEMYNNADSLSYAKSSRVHGQGRSDAHSAVLNVLYKNDSILLGMGPGDIIKSSYGRGYKKDPLLEKYKIGYGGRIGYLWIAMQIGYIGSFLLGLFNLYLLVDIARNNRYIKKDSNYKYILAFYGLSMVYFLDYLTYSSTFLLDPAIILTYLFSYFYIKKIILGDINETR